MDFTDGHDNIIVREAGAFKTNYFGPFSFNFPIFCSVALFFWVLKISSSISLICFSKGVGKGYCCAVWVGFVFFLSFRCGYADCFIAGGDSQ